MRESLNLAVWLTIGCMALSSCGHKGGKKDVDGDSDTDETTDDTTENSGTTDPSYDLATGCTGEEVVAGLLNATHLKLASLPQAKQTSIAASQSRLQGERSLELSTGSHVTAKLNLTADVGTEFVSAWKDSANAANADIVAAYGAYPAGDRLSYVLFGNAFYLSLIGGKPSQEAVATIGELLDSLDAPTTNPADNSQVPAVGDDARVIAIIAAIGTGICIN